MSDVAVRSVVATAIWHQGFVHPCSEISTNMATPLKILPNLSFEIISHWALDNLRLKQPS
jgi:hypothetical protein